MSEPKQMPTYWSLVLEVAHLNWWLDKLVAENAELRELVRESWQSCPVNASDCRICPHYIGESGDDWCDIPMRMRELRIKVDG